MTEIYVIAHDMRSTYNVGSLFRTCEGIGVTKLYLTGYTPYPMQANDPRLPHISRKLDDQIEKTALGSQESLDWEHSENLEEVISELKSRSIVVAALEQTPSAIDIRNFKTPNKIAIVLGTEVTGIPLDVIKLTDIQLVIPMFGKKESYNVVQATAMALYHFRFEA